ncbi:MAG: winged helix DNA-binding protein [Steroidobacteraceae bacterium]|nr:winged helix DNA-binding protein [Steroidobacteraceae bacterium]
MTRTGFRAAALPARRLANQRLSRTTFSRPADVVAWFGAVQAQDYLGALWALRRRLRRGTEATIEAALAQRTLIRCWPMRGTLHFVAAEDARWITRLLAPRVLARTSGFMKRTLDLDATVAARARDVVTRALEGGRRLDRAGIYEALEAGKIRCGGMRGQHILLWLAMDGTLCQTGRIGRQHAFALLDEWLPESRVLTGQAAFAELARRYFTSHGPASVQDFAWWAGITQRDAIMAIDAAGDALRRERLDDCDLWSGAKATRPTTARKPQVALLPAFDEYTVAYKDRTAVGGTGRLSNPMALLNPLVIVDGLAVGTWQRKLHREGARVRVRATRTLTRAEWAALEDEVRDYGEFLGSGARLVRR